MLTVFADQHLYKIREIAPTGINLHFYDPEEGFPSQLDQADALLVRTVTDINKKTLPNIPKNLKFVGTGSAGIDHIDTEYLASHGIEATNSAGCNARSVAEYVITALLLWGEQKNITLENETIGIIGVGHVGQALQKMLDSLGWSYRLYDPPRSERNPSFESAELREVLDCSVLTFHTPLHEEGKHSTYHWLNQKKISGRRYKMVINTARGGVIDGQALMQAKASGRVEDMIIDVWENEPAFDDNVARTAFIATPHIAGYSIQAKFRATKMVVDQMVTHFGLDLPIASLNKKKEQITLPDQDYDSLSLPDLLTTIHPIKKYGCELNKLIGIESESKKTKFSRLRTSMPLRNEYAYLGLPAALIRSFPFLHKIGINI
ncbi:4-phosphoerythronate dehydrogenase [Aliifodinibius sp. S!AR15-10]|uniref:4-phosphoerythronate dehydrogenase n=1 Tax=Aliifodinibius sp. S!AR15-10 TaxID=2950437 RepID=UPI00286415D2|nr:4-phosphoerythronate dehydrogenase [Aliifodinibius sp. S!AR15-10]MDR8389757.1 4-phosphoerythronate dehydrogenase [Aliifodinibius sp. S!AR15-10]